MPVVQLRLSDLVDPVAGLGDELDCLTVLIGRESSLPIQFVTRSHSPAGPGSKNPSFSTPTAAYCCPSWRQSTPEEWEFSGPRHETWG